MNRYGEGFIGGQVNWIAIFEINIVTVQLIISFCEVSIMINLIG